MVTFVVSEAGPDRRRSSVSRPVVNRRRESVAPDPSICASRPFGSLVQAASPFFPRAPGASVPSVPGRSLATRSVTGQVSERTTWPGAISARTAGSSVMPLSTPYSSWSNQRCRVPTHSARSESKGSTWPSRVRNILRSTPCSPSASHQREKFWVSTLVSWRPCMISAEARTLEASPRVPSR